MAHDRGEVDDAAVASDFHVGHEGPAHKKRAGEVAVHDAVPFIESEIHQRFAQVHTGVVHQNLDCPETRQDVAFKLRHLVFAGEIGREDSGLSAHRTNGAGCLLQFAGIPRDQSHAHAFSAKRNGARGTRVTLVDSWMIGRTGHSAFSNAWTIVACPDDDIDGILREIVAGNDGIADQELCRQTLIDSYDRLRDFEAIGMTFPRNPDGSYTRRPTRGLDLARVLHPDGTVSTFSASYEPVSGCTVMHYDDAAAEDTHRRKDAYLSNNFRMLIADHLNDLPPVWNSASMLIRMVVKNDTEVFYLNTFAPNDASKVMIYSGGKVKEIGGWMRQIRYMKDGWTFSPTAGYPAFQGTMEEKSLVSKTGNWNGAVDGVI
jgi:hypothetical protein